MTRPSASSVLGGLATAALNFVYPPHCLLCNIELGSNHSPAENARCFCDGCFGSLIPATGNMCRRCGAPLGPFTKVEQGCPVCQREHFAFQEVVRLGLYRDELRTACLLAKNRSGALLAQALADLLMEVRRDALVAAAADLVIPIPEHWLKRLVRTHYAAETIARTLASRLNVPLATGILAKVKWTPKQATSPPTRRREQQRGAFATTRKPGLTGKKVLLVDDILTTGATSDEAARMLKRAGASQVIVAVLAVSPPAS